MGHGEALVGNGGPAWWTSRVASPQVSAEAGGVCPVVPAGVPWVEARADDNGSPLARVSGGLMAAPQDRP
jgi:hypothetical protein